MYVFTEEQVRCFIVENLRSARFSYKMTAKCGLRIKQANVCQTNGAYNYLNMLCNDGSLVGMSSNDIRIRTSKQITKVTLAQIMFEPMFSPTTPSESVFQRLVTTET